MAGRAVPRLPCRHRQVASPVRDIANTARLPPVHVRGTGLPPSSQVAAMSARSWVSVLSSSGPCMARAAAVARFPDPGRGIGGQVSREPGHAVPGRGKQQPPVGRRFRVAFLDADRVVPFPPGPGLGPEPAGHHLPGGAPRAGFGAAGSRKWASNACAPSGLRPLVSSTTIRACCQEMVPASKDDNVNGSAVVSSWASASRLAAAASLTVSTPASSATRAIPWALSSCRVMDGDAMVRAS